MLQVKNETPFVPGLAVLPDLAGVDTLLVLVKATFAIRPEGLEVAAAQRPIVPAGETWGDPATTSLRYAGEVHLPKPATDVLVVGDAFAPGGRPAPRFGVSLSVGKLQKTLAVSGDRVWRGGLGGLTPSEPAPTIRVPLRWERAYGGRHDLGGGQVLMETRNPVGVGFQGKRSSAELKGTPVPNVEHLRQLMTSASERPSPAGLGPIGPAWEPRARFAGTYDARWAEERAPYFPDDLDPRFFQTAPPDQIHPGFLQGGEPVMLQNLSPAGVDRFALPVCAFDVAVTIAGQVERPALRLDTLLLEPGEGVLSMLWRGVVPCDKRALKVEKVRVGVKVLTGVRG